MTFVDDRERWPWAVFFAGVALTAFGSAWYHLDPGNLRLVWDRLPMTVAFMGLFAAMIGERIGPRVGLALLGPLLVAGVGSVLWWHAGEQQGRGDLRAYGLVQFFPMLAIPLLAWLFPARYTHGGYWASRCSSMPPPRALELADAHVLALGGLVSGHALKHLARGGGGLRVLPHARAPHHFRRGTTMIDDETRGKALGRLRRIEGQVQGLQRMVEEDTYCVDILLQISAVQGALEQVQKLLLGRHIESCVTDAIRSGNGRDRQQKMDELLDVFSRFGGR